MAERRRFLLLILTMAVVTLTAVGIGTKLLYDAAFEEERARLIDAARSQARLIEAIARFDSVYSQDYPGGALPATLSQIIDAHEQHTGFGETGEYDLARREGDQIVFLLSHRSGDGTDPSSVPFDSDLAEPMRLALQGESGSIVGLDHSGELVLAGYEPVAELDLGIVVKIDLTEVNRPFVVTGWIVAATAIVAIVLGAWFFRRITAPVERQMKRYSEQLEDMVEERTSELRKAQAELVRSERLATLGQFSGNISHELRNPLGVIDSSVYYLKRKLGGDDEKVSEHLDRIKLSVANSTAIIESLLSLTRMKEPSLAETDLVAVVTDSVATSRVP
ncbi:MAG: histidine kinase dimerization/phospho-acceptor domain-containing protein, partial [Dehalococcoidales bacterium]